MRYNAQLVGLGFHSLPGEGAAIGKKVSFGQDVLLPANTTKSIIYNFRSINFYVIFPPKYTTFGVLTKIGLFTIIISGQKTGGV